jgi:patatin-like phospholipase/acyl hydrolase/TPR repeat protein
MKNTKSLILTIVLLSFVSLPALSTLEDEENSLSSSPNLPYVSSKISDLSSEKKDETEDDIISKEIKRLEKNNDAKSYCELGVIYHGWRSEFQSLSNYKNYINLRRAKEYYKKAVEQEPNAKTGLGWIYEHQYKIEGLHPKLEKAAKCYEEAANLGNRHAAFYLAEMCRKGKGVNQDFEKAIYWYKKADDLSGKVNDELAKVLYHREQTKEAKERFLKAAKNGYTPAQLNIARVLIYDGKYEEALAWLKEVEDKTKHRTYLKEANELRENIKRKTESQLLIQERKVIRILAIDGGGVRGAIPAAMLQTLEEKLNAKISQKYPGQKIYISQLVDIIAGTSAGGIIALGLAVPNRRTGELNEAKEVVKLFTEEGKTIFPDVGYYGWVRNFVRPRFSSLPLEKILERRFENAWLKEVYPRVIIPSHEVKLGQYYLFDSKKARNSELDNFRVRDVALSTASAPVYFRPAAVFNEKNNEHWFIDGGLYANDPTRVAFKVAKKLNPDADIVILSLGTGNASNSTDYSSSRNWGVIGWVEKVIDILMGSSNQINADYLEEKKKEGKIQNYIRINPQIDSSISPLDQSKNIDRLVHQGKVISRKGNAEYQNFKEAIKELEKAYEEKKEHLEIISHFKTHLIAEDNFSSPMVLNKDSTFPSIYKKVALGVGTAAICLIGYKYRKTFTWGVARNKETFFSWLRGREPRE